jgi:hypothetical protein
MNVVFPCSDRGGSLAREHGSGGKSTKVPVYEKVAIKRVDGSRLGSTGNGSSRRYEEMEKNRVLWRKNERCRKHGKATEKEKRSVKTDLARPSG